MTTESILCVEFQNIVIEDKREALITIASSQGCDLMLYNYFNYSARKKFHYSLKIQYKTDSDIAFIIYLL